jgi:two-component system response regulator YesN
MEKAAEMLKTTSSKVYEVAFQVGYDNNTHFTKVFKEYFGISPMEYKRSLGS